MHQRGQGVQQADKKAKHVVREPKVPMRRKSKTGSKHQKALSYSKPLNSRNVEFKEHRNLSPLLPGANQGQDSARDSVRAYQVQYQTHWEGSTQDLLSWTAQAKLLQNSEKPSGDDLSLIFRRKACSD